MPELPDEITIDITDADIAAGWRLLCNKCPAALAWQRATGDPEGFVGGEDETVDEPVAGAFGQLYRLPPSLDAFILTFDLGCAVHPGKHTLTAI